MRGQVRLSLEHESLGDGRGEGQGEVRVGVRIRVRVRVRVGEGRLRRVRGTSVSLGCAGLLHLLCLIPEPCPDCQLSAVGRHPNPLPLMRQYLSVSGGALHHLCKAANRQDAQVNVAQALRSLQAQACQAGQACQGDHAVTARPPAPTRGRHNAMVLLRPAPESIHGIAGR